VGLSGDSGRLTRACGESIAELVFNDLLGGAGRWGGIAGRGCGRDGSDLGGRAGEDDHASDGDQGQGRDGDREALQTAAPSPGLALRSGSATVLDV
jgi:hypothetical protein